MQLKTNNMTRYETQGQFAKEEGIETPTIYATRNYSIFKDLQGNRIIKAPHLKQLAASIEENNMLAHEPMVVNENLRVIDGQHRLRIASSKNIPIYYTILPGAGIREVTLLNATTLIWDTKDYLISYVEQGLPDYIKLMNFAKRHADYISLPMALLFLVGDFATPFTLRRKYKNGEFVVKSEQEAELFATQVKRLLPWIKDSTHQSREFIWALKEVLENVPFEELLSKVEKYSLYIHRQPNKRRYMRQFEDIMNYRQRENTYRFY